MGCVHQPIEWRFSNGHHPAHVPDAEKALPSQGHFKEKLIQLSSISVVLIVGPVVCYLLAMKWGQQSGHWRDLTLTYSGLSSASC